MPGLTMSSSSSSNNGISASNIQNISALEVDFRRESHRLLTFPENWVDICPYLSKEDLAANGFFFTGPGDSTRCAFCRLIIKNWEQIDTAAGEHRRWNPTCPFINGRYVGNVKVQDEGRHQNIAYDLMRSKIEAQKLKKKYRRVSPKSKITKPRCKTFGRREVNEKIALSTIETMPKKYVYAI